MPVIGELATYRSYNLCQKYRALILCDKMALVIQYGPQRYVLNEVLKAELRKLLPET